MDKLTQALRHSSVLQGVPVRIEVGQGTCVAARRDRPGKEGKQFGIPLDPQGFVDALKKLLDEVQVSCPPVAHISHLNRSQQKQSRRQACLQYSVG